MIPMFLFNCFMKFLISLQLLLYPDQEALTFLMYVEELRKKEGMLRNRDRKQILKWNPSPSWSSVLITTSSVFACFLPTP